MVRPPTLRPTRIRAALHAVGAVSAAAVLTAGLAAPVQAQDAGMPQLEDLQAILNTGGGEVLPAVPGSPTLPNIPGIGQAGGGEVDIAGGIKAAADPFVPEGGFREQITSAPTNGLEVSTRPDCAPNVFVGVPGTFEINRDDDPNQPVGLLGNFVTPLKQALGGQLSATFINYDGDAGVNGTAYQRSVDSGQKKTLATMVDVAKRCEGSQIFLAGFSQGAEIAGNVAMEIGQKRTEVDPGRIGGVVLFSDPRRDENSNLIVGTAQQRPLLPEIITGAIDEALKDPSLAQLRSAIDPVNDLSRIFSGQDLLPNIPSSADELLQPRTGTGGTGDRTDGATGGAPQSGGGLPQTGGGLPDIGDGGGLPEIGGAPQSGGGLPQTGGGLPDIGDGGGLPEIGGANYEVDGTLNINNGLYILPYGASGPAVVQGDYSHPAGGGPSIILANNESPAHGAQINGQQILGSVGADLTDEQSTEFAAAFRDGDCGTASLIACLTSYIDNGHTLDTDEAATSESGDNPHAQNLVNAEGDPADLQTLAEMCLGRGSAESCGGSHPPADVEEATGENRPKNATALVTIPVDATDGCESSPRSDDCTNGVTRTEIKSVTSVPARDDVRSYWETADNAAALKVMQIYGSGLAAQVAAAQTAFAGGDLSVPSGVSYLVNQATAETKNLALADAEESGMVAVTQEGSDDAVAVDEARTLLTQGWQLGRTGSDERSRPRAVESLFAVGGCDDKTLQDCIRAHAKDSGEPESAVTTATLVATAAQAEATTEEGAPSRDQLPAAFAEECLTKSFEDCAGGAASRGVPSLPPVIDVANEIPEPAGPATPTTQVTDRTGQGTATQDYADQGATGGGLDSGDTTSSEQVSTPAGDAQGGSSPTASAEGAQTSEGVETENNEAGAAPTTSERRQAGAAPETSERRQAGAAPETSERRQAGAAPETSTSAPSSAPAATGSAPVPSSEPSREGERVDVEELTIQAVSGGGLSGPREADFGALTGRVASPCVPGDIVCSLPEDSQLARSLVQLGRNVALNVNDLANAEGPTRMGGMLAVQAVDTVLQVTGLPELKLSPETIIAIINLVAGVGLIHMGDVPTGTALIATTITQLPTAIPEVIEQLQDIPEIIAGLPKAGENAAKNLGLVTDRVGEAFDTAGLGNPTDLSNLPAMLPGLIQALVQDNTGLIELVTNPMYYTSGDKHDAFDTLKVAGDTNAIQWHQRWLVELGEELQAMH